MMTTSRASFKCGIYNWFNEISFRGKKIRHLKLVRSKFEFFINVDRILEWPDVTAQMAEQVRVLHLIRG